MITIDNRKFVIARNRSRLSLLMSMTSTVTLITCVSMFMRSSKTIILMTIEVLLVVVVVVAPTIMTTTTTLFVSV